MFTKTLIIADSPELPEMLGQTMSSFPDAEIVTLACGLDTLDQLKGRRPDLIILDPYMAGFDGLQILSALKSCSCGPRVQVLALLDADKCCEEVVRCGVDGIVVRPFSGEDLGAAIRAIFTRAMPRDGGRNVAPCSGG